MRSRLATFVLLAAVLLATVAISAPATKGPVFRPVAKHMAPSFVDGSAPPSNLPPVGSRNPRTLDEVIISEDFEAYAEGDLPPGWIQVDVDGGFCAQFSRNSTWQVFDYGANAHGGTKVAMCHYNDGAVANDDWMILPQQTLGSPITLTYWRASQDAAWVDDYEVRVSTTGTDPADFTDVLIDEDAVPTTWAEVSLDLSAYDGVPFYIAFHYNSVDRFVLKVDDLLLEAAGAGPAGTIAGTVTDATTTDPIEGVLVEIDGTPRSAETDANGDYSIPGITPGTYDINFSHPAYVSATETDVEVVDQQVAVVDMALEAAGSISGTVTDDDTSEPIAGVIVEVVGTMVTAETNAAGFYELVGLDAGTYDVSFDHPFYAEYVENDVDVQLGTATTLDVALTPLGIVIDDVPSTSAPIAISDNQESRMPLQIDDDWVIEDLDVTLNITHTYISDMDFWIEDPAGTQVQLCDDAADFPSGANFIETRFDDEAENPFEWVNGTSGYTGSWQPFGNLSDLDGFGTMGEWELIGFDNEGGDTGTIDGFVLHITHVSSATDGVATPNSFAFHGNYPNPFNPSTTFTFSLENSTHVELVIYNALGQEVSTLLDKNISAGSHSVHFTSKSMPSGVYFARFSAGDFVQTHKMVLLK